MLGLLHMGGGGEMRGEHGMGMWGRGSHVLGLLLMGVQERGAYGHMDL